MSNLEIIPNVRGIVVSYITEMAPFYIRDSSTGGFRYLYRLQEPVPVDIVGCPYSVDCKMQIKEKHQRDTVETNKNSSP